MRDDFRCFCDNVTARFYYILSRFFSCCDIKFKITAIKVAGIMYSFEKDMNDNLCLAATNYIHRILQE